MSKYLLATGTVHNDRVGRVAVSKGYSAQRQLLRHRWQWSQQSAVMSVAFKLSSGQCQQCQGSRDSGVLCSVWLRGCVARRGDRVTYFTVNNNNVVVR